MTDKPRTVALGIPEWRTLALHNVGALYQFLEPLPAPDQAQHAMVRAQLERVASLIEAWHRSAVIAAPQPQPEPPRPAAPAPATNGAGAKRKGGWPRGKPRKRMAPLYPPVQ